MRLDGKIALVTGVEDEASAAIARRFAQEGAKVAACAGSRLRPGSQTTELGAGVLVLEGDLRLAADAQRVVDGVVARYGGLDILVNFGAMRRVVGSIMDISDEDFQQEMEWDLKTVIVVSRSAIPEMAKRGGGAIVNITSIARAGVKGRALRSASKAALATLTRSMALDHAAQGIRVNALLLGPTLTSDLLARPEEVRRLEETAPLKQVHTPEDVAAAALFLVSDEAARITGALLPVDAGRSLPSF